MGFLPGQNAALQGVTWQMLIWGEVTRQKVM